MDYEDKHGFVLGDNSDEYGGFEYTIPDGFEAEIKNGKVIVRKKWSKDERIRQELIQWLEDKRCNTLTPFSLRAADEWIAWLKKKPVMWKRIRKGETLPCSAYLWHIVYEPNCKYYEGRLIPNVEGVKVGMDTWYLPAEDVKNLPKEE